MSPITFAIWVLMGLLAGLLAGFVTKRGGYGRRGDVLVGLVGSLGAGGFCWALGVSRGLVAVVITFAGAAMVIALQRWRWPASDGHAVDATRRGSRPVWGVER
jgi:uncharacterized membrane protein YeaQ/YmgE (transglycosylase-associated protein family)